MIELWQLYDEQGRPIIGKGAPKPEVRKGLLHGASHIWIWRRHSGQIEVLLQKRAGGKMTWPDRYDISAAGHIDLGEDPLEAAVREVSEEIGLTILADDLKSAGVIRTVLVEEPTGIIENEFQYIYTFELTEDVDYSLQAEEVNSIEWKAFTTLQQEFAENDQTGKYVPHASSYFAQIVAAIRRHAA